MSREIPLTRGLVAIVDDDDYERVAAMRWHVSGDPAKRRTVYAVSGGGRGGPAVFMHRLVVDAPAGAVVDHINGESLDNRRSNLRICTQVENLKNRRISVNNKTGFKGVFFHENRYRVSIQVDGKQTSVGAFACPIKAARAYDVAAQTHYGEFARLNFSPERDWLFPHEHQVQWPQRDAA